MALALGNKVYSLIEANKTEKAQLYLANLQHNFGVCYYKLGQHQNAQSAYRYAQLIYQRLGLHERAGSINMNLALVLKSMQRFDEAYELFQIARKVARDAGWGRELALVNMNLGLLILSRWPISDQNAVQMTQDFYSELLQVNSIAAALRFAQCQAIKRQEHPFFWAGYIHLAV